jgi:hypothetical protein
MGIPIFLVIALTVSIAVSLLVGVRRCRRDMRPYLEPTLRQCGVELITIANPTLFKVGPFPKVEVERGRPQSNILGFSGEYNQGNRMFNR